MVEIDTVQRTPVGRKIERPNPDIHGRLEQNILFLNEMCDDVSGHKIWRGTETKPSSVEMECRVLIQFATPKF